MQGRLQYNEKVLFFFFFFTVEDRLAGSEGVFLFLYLFCSKYLGVVGGNYLGVVGGNYGTVSEGVCLFCIFSVQNT